MILLQVKTECNHITREYKIIERNITIILVMLFYLVYLIFFSGKANEPTIEESKLKLQKDTVNYQQVNKEKILTRLYRIK